MQIRAAYTSCSTVCLRCKATCAEEGCWLFAEGSTGRLPRIPTARRAHKDEGCGATDLAKILAKYQHAHGRREGPCIPDESL